MRRRTVLRTLCIGAAACAVGVPKGWGGEKSKKDAKADAVTRTETGAYALRFAQPFVVTLCTSGRPRALLAVELKAEVSARAAEAARAEIVLRDAITRGLVEAAAAGALGRGYRAPSDTVLRAVVGGALDTAAPRGGEGVEVLQARLMPLRRSGR